MRKTTEDKAQNRLTVAVERLVAMLSCGEVTAKKIADYAEARVVVGRRVLYNVDKIKKYIDAMACLLYTSENHQITAVDMNRENLDGETLSRFPLVQGEQIRWEN